ncbi:MAG: hypothetical protein ACRETL_11165, partial [Gammaproteobacteria bacterium]
RKIPLCVSTSIRLADIEAIAADELGAGLAKLMREQLHLLPEFSSAVSNHDFNLIGEIPHRVQARRTPAERYSTSAIRPSTATVRR